MRSLSPVIPEESLGGHADLAGPKLTVRPNSGMTDTRDLARAVVPSAFPRERSDEKRLATFLASRWCVTG
jgi:hypothetical protein